MRDFLFSEFLIYLKCFPGPYTPLISTSAKWRAATITSKSISNLGLVNFPQISSQKRACLRYRQDITSYHPIEQIFVGPFPRISNWVYFYVKSLNEIHSESCLHLTSKYLLTPLKMHEATLLASCCIPYVFLVGLKNPHIVPSLINITIRYKKTMVPNLGPCRFHFNTSWTKGRRGVDLAY